MASLLPLHTARCTQRLYVEIRRALRAFYVKPLPGGIGGSGDTWTLWELGGRTKVPADANALPGPFGGHRLLIKPQAKVEGTPDELPKVCAPSRFGLGQAKQVRGCCSTVLSSKVYSHLSHCCQACLFTQGQGQTVLDVRCVTVCARQSAGLGGPCGCSNAAGTA